MPQFRAYAIAHGNKWSNLCQIDILLLADVQRSAELLGLDEQLHSLLMLIVPQEKVSCNTNQRNQLAEFCLIF